MTPLNTNILSLILAKTRGGDNLHRNLKKISGSITVLTVTEIYQYLHPYELSDYIFNNVDRNFINIFKEMIRNTRNQLNRAEYFRDQLEHRFYSELDTYPRCNTCKGYCLLCYHSEDLECDNCGKVLCLQCQTHKEEFCEGCERHTCGDCLQLSYGNCSICNKIACLNCSQESNNNHNAHDIYCIYCINKMRILCEECHKYYNSNDIKYCYRCDSAICMNCRYYGECTCEDYTLTSLSSE